MKADKANLFIVHIVRKSEKFCVRCNQVQNKRPMVYIAHLKKTVPRNTQA